METSIAPAQTSADASTGASALSVIVVTPERFSSLRRTVRHLREQTVQDQIELIIVAPSEEALGDLEPGELGGFHSVQHVTVGPIRNVDKAAAHGVPASHAPVVAFVEDHAYPTPGWAEALLEAHEGPWGVVGSLMLNANPGSMLSWTNLLIAYGPWTAPAAGGEMAALPGHNISYKRDLLTQYGENLEQKLGRDGGLLESLQAQGHRLYLEPEAGIYHANPSLLSSTSGLRFDAGRLYGATRAEQHGWSPAQRLLYIAGGPLIPLVRFKRLREELFGDGRRDELRPRVFPALMLGLVLDGLGQMAGYAFGPGGTTERLALFEMDRPRHLTPADRKALAE